MENLELTFASNESQLSVRRFHVEQRLNAPFEIRIVALSRQEDVDLEALVGVGATLRLGAQGDGLQYRLWTGICSHAEQAEVEPDGASTYHLTIVPDLWRTTVRKNSRVFQHQSLPEIVLAVLGDWKIEAELELDLARFPRFEYRVQYGETDFAFISRILEEAGVSYYFRDADGAKGETQTVLVLSGAPERKESRGPVAFINRQDGTGRGEYVSQVRLAHEARAGRLTLRDYDFRSRPDLDLFAEARSTSAHEHRLELYSFEPGAFVFERKEGANDGQAAAVDEREAKALAERRLAAARSGRRTVAFATSVFDLHPGRVFSMVQHPRADVEGHNLLVVHQVIEGRRDGEFTATGHAVYSSEAYKPLQVTPKPKIVGVQSALVVGPSGQEIHTDEFGRVRVQFHWDREGQRDHKSSCFIRVSQAWAGRGYGVHAVPRVGDEVLVGFFEGDPDQPVIVGRVHNSASRVPHNLPVSKTRTSWKSESSPGGGGWNEMSLEDAKGQELIFFHAEKDLERVVKNDEKATIGASLTTSVGKDESHQIANDHTLRVGGNRSARVEGTETISVGHSFSLQLGDSGTGVAVTADKRIVLSTGEASIVLDGPNIYFDGHASIRMSAGALVAMSGQEVHLDGQPNLFLNSLGATPPGVAPLMSAASTAATVLLETAEERSLTKLLSSPVEAPGAAPEALALPAHIEAQLQQARDKLLTGVQQIETAVKDKAQMLEDELKGKLGELKQNLVPKVEAARAELNALVDKARGLVEQAKAEAAGLVTELKSRAAALKAEVESKIQMAKDMIQSVKDQIRAVVTQVHDRVQQVITQARALIDGIKQRIIDIKNQIKQTFDDLRKRAIAVVQGEVAAVKGLIQSVKDQIKGIITQVKTTIDDIKAQVHQIVATVKADIQAVKDQVHQIVAGIKSDIQQIKGEIKATINEVKGEIKSVVNEVKTDIKNLKTEAKAIVTEVKTEAKQIVTDAKQVVGEVKAEAKQIASEVKTEAKQIAGEAKQVVGEVKAEAKQVVGEVKAEAKQIAGEVKTEAKQIATEAKGAVADAKGAVQQAGQELKGAVGDAKASAQQAAQGAKSALNDPTVQFSHHINGAGGVIPNAPVSPPASGIITKPGGFGGDTAARAINSNPGATYLQSPTDGQLMVVRTQLAQPLSPEHLSASIVEHQMNGMATGDAMTSVLRDHGYVVYERPWESMSGMFVQKAAL